MLTIASTVLVGRRCWEGWALATVNSVIICIIAVRTAQFGFVPANVFCIAMSVINLHSWRSAHPEAGRESQPLPSRYFHVRELDNGYVLVSAPTEADPTCSGSDLMPTTSN